MKHIFTHLAFLCLFGTATVGLNAQQDPQFSQYMYNKLFMNPGYAGMKHAICFTGIMRQQWAGFDGSPRSGVFSGDWYAEPLHGGLGVNFLYDQLGFEKNLAYRINYSFHVENVLGGTLGIGIEGGGMTKTLGPTGSQSWVSTTNWTNDPTVPPQLKASKMDFGAGVWYERENMWFGISSTHLSAQQFYGGTVNVNNLPHPMVYQAAHHYFITGGYSHAMQNWKLQPSFLVKSDATVTSFDLNFTALYNDKIWFGASYRHEDAICPMIGFNWINEKNTSGANGKDSYDGRLGAGGGRIKTQMLRVGFAYDYTLSNLRNYNNGTFELFVNYCIPWESLTSKHYDVRLFD
jgi:type IX secretion system PorP/SprF family membrane protein